MGGPRLLSVNLSEDGYTVYAQVGTSASGKNLLSDQNNVGIYRTVDFDKDGKVDVYYTPKQSIPLDDKFRARVKNPRSTPATPQEKKDAEQEYTLGKLLAMKLYNTFKKALSDENKIRIEISDSGNGNFGSMIALYDSTNRTVGLIYLSYKEEDGKKSVTQFELHRILGGDEKFTYSDPQLISPIQNELNALLQKQLDSVSLKND